jgi:hypothetical protein
MHVACQRLGQASAKVRKFRFDNAFEFIRISGAVAVKGRAFVILASPAEKIAVCVLVGGSE